MNRTLPASRLTTAKVRLSNPAVLAGSLSLLYAVVLMLFPRAFPELLQRIFQRGHFFTALAVLLLAANEILFLFIFRRRVQKPGLLTPGYIAFLTIGVVFAFWLLVNTADLEHQLSQLSLPTSSPVRDGINSEELLVYTHLGMVAGIVFPYLLVRLTQNYGSGTNSAERDAKARHMAAGQ